ncbi:MAG: type II toxin-antitoxin system VapC family toxin [Nocardioides sp.]
MIGLDTNVLLRWLVRDVPEHVVAADAVMASLSVERPGFVTQVTVVEMAWALRSTYQRTKTEVLDVLEALLRTRELEFDDGESMWEAVVHARAGADFADALIAETFRLYGVEESVTFDRDAARRFGMRLLG